MNHEELQRRALEQQTHLSGQQGSMGGMVRPAPAPAPPKPEDEAFVTLNRYGFAILEIEGAPPVILVNPERVLMAVLK